jgi:hypothetical protein
MDHDSSSCGHAESKSAAFDIDNPPGLLGTLETKWPDREIHALDPPHTNLTASQNRRSK